MQHENKPKNTFLTILVALALIISISTLILTLKGESDESQQANQTLQAESDAAVEQVVYEDDYLSFAVPSDMVLLKDQVGEGRLMFMLDWVAPSKDGDHLETLGMVNPQLRYPYYLQDHDYETWDELYADNLSAAQEDILVKVEELKIGGQEAILVDAGGFCEHHYNLYIKGPRGTIYELVAGCLANEDWGKLFGVFKESATFKQ